jgi:hypothetical protein
VSQTDGPEPVGSVAEEAAKLFGALSGWAREHGEGVGAMAESMAGGMAGELHDHLATGSPECGWCPVCRTVAAVRHTSPEVRAHLASAASSLMMAVSGMMATRPPTRDSAVERIDLDDAGEAGDWPEDDS